MISTKQGSLASSGMMRRSSEIEVLAPMTTKALASASPVALATVLLTASSGQRPNSCAHAGLLAMVARLKSLLLTGCLTVCLLALIGQFGTGLIRHFSQGLVGNGGATDVVQL